MSTLEHIGIAAVSPEGAALFYRLLSRHSSRMLGTGAQPRISIHNEPLTAYLAAIQRDDWHSVGKLLRRSADLLARCGAQICITPDNVVQHAVQLAEVGSPIPWLTMPELVASAIARDGRKTVGILATKIVAQSSTYQTHLGLRGVHLLTPTEAESNALDHIIYSELIYGYARPESRECAHAMVKSLAQNGCEGVILASSEIPLLLDAATSPLPVYDAGEILALATIERARGSAKA